MALIKCEECGKEISSRASVCPNCGCPVEAIIFEPVSQNNQDNNDIIKYLDMAQTALNGRDGEEAYNYANKILEINPRNTIALEMKMLSLQLLGTLGDTRISAVIECGEKAIEFSSLEGKAAVQDRIYTHFLNRAFELLVLANDKIRDVEEVKRVFQSFALISLFTCGDRTLQADASAVNLIDSLAQDALTLKTCVPESLIHDVDKYQQIVVSISNMYSLYSEGLQERYKIYGASLTQEAITARQEILGTFSRGIITEAERKAERVKEKTEYWQMHKEEAEELVRKREVIMENIKAIETAIQKLSIFKGKEKAEMKRQVDILKQEERNLRIELEGE